jgi:hypothetical protein
MSRAEQFRQDAAQFWSDIDHRKVVVAGHKPTPTRSGGMPTKRRAGAASPKSKNKNKH